ncbi:MAG: septum formation initiator family protein [Candidatus Beckwithbacteria bacterium]
MSTSKKRLLAYTVLVLSILMSIKLVKDIVKLKSADTRLTEAETEFQAAQQEQAELKQQLIEIEDKSWWEKQVRNILKMAKPEEIIVVVPDEVKNSRESPTEAQSEAVTELPNWQQWWQVVVD